MQVPIEYLAKLARRYFGRTARLADQTESESLPLQVLFGQAGVKAESGYRAAYFGLWALVGKHSIKKRPVMRRSVFKAKRLLWVTLVNPAGVLGFSQFRLPIQNESA